MNVIIINTVTVGCILCTVKVKFIMVLLMKWSH